MSLVQTIHIGQNNVVAKSFQLLVRQGPEVGRTFSLVAAETIIGRSPLSDVVLDDIEVSRQHVRLIRTDEGHRIQDMGSTNGTFVAGRRLGGEPVDLEPGQTIRIGSSVELLYQALSAADSLDALLARPVKPSPRQTFVEGAPPATPFDETPKAVDDPDDEPSLVEPQQPPEPQRAVEPQRPRRQDRAPARSPAATPKGPAAESQRRRRMILVGVAAGVFIVLLCFCLLLAFLVAIGSPDVSEINYRSSPIIVSSLSIMMVSAISSS